MRAARLVDQLPGLQVEGVAGAAEERLEVLDERRDDELEAGRLGRVEQTAPQALDAPRHGGQDIGDVLRQQPGGRHAEGGREQ